MKCYHLLPLVEYLLAGYLQHLVGGQIMHIAYAVDRLLGGDQSGEEMLEVETLANIANSHSFELDL